MNYEVNAAAASVRGMSGYYPSMPKRTLIAISVLCAGIAAAAMSHSFSCKVTGKLGTPIRFEFFDSAKHPKTDIRSFSVSTRTEDYQWRAMWSILSGPHLKQSIEYGVTPPGFTTMIKPQKFMAGRVYAASATDEHGGSAKVTFAFDKDGTMIFPDSFDQ